MSLPVLARADQRTPSLHLGVRHAQQAMGRRHVFATEDGRYLAPTEAHWQEPHRVIMHPSYRNADWDDDVHGIGYYVYHKNPSYTIGLGWDAIRKKDTLAARTLEGTPTAARLHRWSDVVIEEVWTADGQSRTEVWTEMYNVFRQYLMTIPAIGRYVGWCPFDQSFVRYFVEIVDVQLGPAARTDTVRFLAADTRHLQDTYQREALRLRLKLVSPFTPPRGEISFTGA